MNDRYQQRIDYIDLRLNDLKEAVDDRDWEVVVTRARDIELLASVLDINKQAL